MPVALSMVPLHSLGQDSLNEVQHDCLDDVTLMVLVSACDTTGIVNGTIIFDRSRQLRQGAI